MTERKRYEFRFAPCCGTEYQIVTVFVGDTMKLSCGRCNVHFDLSFGTTEEQLAVLRDELWDAALKPIEVSFEEVKP